MVGTTIAHYRILSLLGRGGMGEVFLAEDETLGRKVVLKALPPSFVADEDRRRRFEREARAVAALNHPGIVTIYGVERAGDTLLLAMEFVDGQTLSRLIPPTGLPVDALIRIALALSEAVGVAHQHGIVHRDLKPDNVMVTTDGRVKVLDFGLAKLLDRPSGPEPDQGTPGAGPGPTPTVSATELGVIVGTPHYMSPEQAQGLPVDHRTDIFSLGVVMYEMAAGLRPFEGTTSVAVLSSILRDAPRPLEQARPELPAPLGRLIERCLEKDPDRRFQGALDLHNELQEVAAGISATEAARPVPPVSEPAAPVVTRRSRTRFAAAGAGLLLALLLGTGAWWLVGRSRVPEVPLDPARVAIAPFANRTGDGSLDGLGSMAAASIAKLLAGEGISVAADDSGGRDAGREGLGRSAALDRARRAGAGLAVSGDLRFVGSDLVFQGQLTDVAADRDVRSFGPIAVPRGTPNAIAPLIEQRAVGTTLFFLRGAGGMTGFSRETIARMEAPSYDAYREFRAGLENFGTNMREAKRHFEKVLETDPQLWWCLGWLVPTYESLGEFDKAEQVLARVRPAVPPAGKAAIEYFSARLGGRLVEAHNAARAARDAMPKHLPTATVAAWAARDIGRPQEALDVLLPITPDSNANASGWRGWVETVSQAHHMLGRYEEERGVGVRAVATVPGTALGLLVQARALSAQGRMEELRKVLEACLTVPPSARPQPGLIIVTAASELRAHGHREESLKVAAQALRWLNGLDTTLASSVPMRWLRGDTLALLGRWAEASATYEKLAATVPTSTGVRSELGVVAAERGDAAAARRASDALAQMNRPYIRGVHTYGRARIAAALGERDRAVDLLREAFAEGQALAWTVHGDHAFERLRGYAPFEQLTAMNQKP